MAVSRMVPNSPPQIGGVLSMTQDNLPLSVAILMTGFSRTTSSFGPLPFDAANVGAPGCFGRVSPDVTLLLLGTGNTAVWNFPIPNVTAYLGIVMFHQSLVLDPGVNTLGAVFSDASATLIGH